jgi:hypothetical protein
MLAYARLTFVYAPVDHHAVDRRVDFRIAQVELRRRVPLRFGRLLLRGNLGFAIQNPEVRSVDLDLILQVLGE